MQKIQIINRKQILSWLSEILTKKMAYKLWFRDPYRLFGKYQRLKERI